MKIKSIKKLLPTFIFSLVCANSTLAFEKPVLLAEQGSFFAGGSVLRCSVCQRQEHFKPIFTPNDTQYRRL